MPKKENLKSLNIQFFAEGDDSKTEPKTYTEEEYLKLKNAFDKKASELADINKKLKDKMTEEEKTQAEQKQKDEEYVKMQQELSNLKMSRELISGGFESKEIEQIVESVSSGNTVDLCKVLNNIRKSLVENITKQVKDDLMKSNSLPKGSSSDDGEESIGSRLGRENVKKNSARDFFTKK